MKTFFGVMSLCLAFTAYAEVWEKPKYEADENHLPQEEIERQEEIKLEETIKQHQEDKKPLPEDAKIIENSNEEEAPQ